MVLIGSDLRGVRVYLLKTSGKTVDNVFVIFLLVHRLEFRESRFGHETGTRRKERNL